MYRILVLDDQPVSRLGLKCHFETNETFEIAGAISVGSANLQLLSDIDPDIVLIDPATHDGCIQLIRQYKAARPAALIVIYSKLSNVDEALRSLDAGAIAVVSKSADLEELNIALNRAIRGGNYLDPEMANAVVAKLKHEEVRRKKASQMDFSVREEQVIRGLMKGRTNLEIARSLNLSEKTIKYYVGNLKDKLAVQNRLQIAMAVREQFYA